LGGCAIGYVAVGGAALGWFAAQGGLALAGELAQGGVALARHANDAVALEYFRGFLNLADERQRNWIRVIGFLPLLLLFWPLLRNRKAP
jgi:hypothetical protein